MTAGNCLIGACSSLTAGAKTGDYDSIVQLGKRFVEEVRKARQG